MKRVLVAGLLCPVLLCFAQNAAAVFEKAPPDIDEALRVRVKGFYQKLSEGKFARMIGEYVAEDSQDFFVASKKRQCRKFEIISIKYTDDFSKANVSVACDTDLLIAGAGLLKTTVPVATLWKVVDNNWYWYVEDQKGWKTPFGIMRAATDPAPGGAPAGLPVNPADAMKRNPASIRSAVKVDRSEIQLVGKANQTITVTNDLTGPVTLSISGAQGPGLEVKLERNRIGAKGSTQISLRYTPEPNATRQDLRLEIRVYPTGQVIPIRLVTLPAPKA